MNQHHNHVGFLTLFGRETHRFIRLANQTMIPPLVTVVLYILIFGYSLGSRIKEVEGMSYMVFMIPGLIMMSIINSAYANTSSSLYIARFQGNVQELLVSSMSTLEIVLALVLGGVCRGLVVGTIVTVAAVLIADVPMANPLVILYFSVCVSFIFSCAGFLTAIWAEDFDRLSLFQNYILMPLTYLGGVFFSIKMLPDVWKGVAMANPILYFVNGLRYGFLGISDVNLSIAAVAVFLLACFMFWICWYLFKVGYNIKT